jgi:hypothetical protein
MASNDRMTMGNVKVMIEGIKVMVRDNRDVKKC